MTNRRLILVISSIFVVCSAAILSAEPPSLDPEIVKGDPDFHIQGEYAGEGWGVHVMALGEGKFSGQVFVGGLPGAGYEGDKAYSLEGQRGEERTASLAGEGAALTITAGKTTLKVDGEVVELKRVERQSANAQKKPPNGAVVLFDGSGVEAWRDGASMDDDKRLTEGAMSVAEFGDHRLHLEYLLPFMPEARDMKRGNSGVYVQGRYEVQIVDSFGMPPTKRLHGAIFTVAAPKAPANYPPMRWQTMTIDFTAPRFDKDGKKTANARMTVWQNGVKIHDDVEVPGCTRAAPLRTEAPKGPVYLQDHGNPVRFRNVWVVELKPNPA